MRNSTYVKNTRLVEEWGERVERCYKGWKKGFKIVRHEKTNCIYSLLTQKKLFEIPKGYPIVMNEKVVIVPIEPIEYLFDTYSLGAGGAEDLIGVFNLKGELITFARKLKLYKDFFLISGSTVIHSLWGLYNYEGKELLPQVYYSIESIEANIRNKRHMMFLVASSAAGKGKKALYNSEVRMIVPWADKIKINMTQNKVTVNDGKQEKRYRFVLDRDGVIDIERRY